MCFPYFRVVLNVFPLFQGDAKCFILFHGGA